MFNPCDSEHGNKQAEALSESSVMTESEKLAAYIRSLPNFPKEEVAELWGHMGAILADAVLQAGIDYNAVVYPRAKRIYDDYPKAATTSGFAAVIKERGAGILLEWKGKRKLDTLEELVNVLLENRVETEDDFRDWLAQPENIERLKLIKGLKDKTADYLQILVGIHTVAVDRHLLQFLANAGLPKQSYGEAHRLLLDVAALLEVECSVLDSCIWRYMSQRDNIGRDQP
jgi:hypothetical protein